MGCRQVSAAAQPAAGFGLLAMASGQPMTIVPVIPVTPANRLLGLYSKSETGNDLSIIALSYGNTPGTDHHVDRQAQARTLMQIDESASCGTLASREHYRLGQSHGTFQRFHGNGKLAAKMDYGDGTLLEQSRSFTPATCTSGCCWRPAKASARAAWRQHIEHRRRHGETACRVAPEQTCGHPWASPVEAFEKAEV
jgi:hypothetical protein